MKSSTPFFLSIFLFSCVSLQAVEEKKPTCRWSYQEGYSMQEGKGTADECTIACKAFLGRALPSGKDGDLTFACKVASGQMNKLWKCASICSGPERKGYARNFKNVFFVKPIERKKEDSTK